MKTALIFLHGELTDLSHLPPEARNAELIIAADGGAEHAVKAGLPPDIVIGDMDSISPITFQQLRHTATWESYPREKDYTDAELAIQYALKQNVSKLYIAGFLGRRLDHMLANMAYLATLPVEIVLLEGSQRVFFIHKRSIISGKKDDELSLIPLNEDCQNVTTEGLAYPLHGETLPYGTTRGVSNVLVGKEAVVTVKKGILVCIHSQKIKG